ncbi:MAG: glycyl-radical enzyme activating protein, partial [Clostridia bacterium]|nr:glycyl-radical enzyme activating protein [Clostridia bacterium]
LSYHDGPGLRTTVFLRGCNLRCAWCHNPESQSPKPQLAYYRSSCTGCGICIEHCEKGAITINDGVIVYDRSKCENCGNCADYCVANARRYENREMTAEALVKLLLKDKAYYDKSGGGVTFSGGEPFLQKEFLIEALQLCRESGLHTAVETALCIPSDSLREATPYVDLFMFDMKAMDDDAHRKATGASNKQILANIKLLSELGADGLIRIPIVKGLNDSEENLKATAEFLLRETSFTCVEPLKLHTLATSKYDSLGMDDTLSGFESTDDETYTCVCNMLEAYGIHVIINK